MSRQADVGPRTTRITGVFRAPTIALTLLLTAVTVAAAHDMFLKPTRHLAPENSEVRIRVLNGTFVRSENSIARARLADVSVVSPTRRSPLDTAEWTVTGDTSTFHIHTRGAGTYVVGVSTKPSVIELSGDDFNLYLKEDGIPDMLEARQRASELQKPAKERYSKHIKTLIQVGQARSTHFSTVMGYPAEIVPMENPYDLSSGATLRVRTLVDGKPAANQYVLFGGRTANDGGIEQKSTRSGADGIASIPLSQAGTWYVKFINMVPVRGDSVTHESKWATLTFQVR
jgi:uncharacterized GH25 family protein